MVRLRTSPSEITITRRRSPRGTAPHAEISIAPTPLQPTAFVQRSFCGGSAPQKLLIRSTQTTNAGHGANARTSMARSALSLRLGNVAIASSQIIVRDCAPKRQTVACKNGCITVGKRNSTEACSPARPFRSVCYQSWACLETPNIPPPGHVGHQKARDCHFRTTGFAVHPAPLSTAKQRQRICNGRGNASGVIREHLVWGG